MEKLFILFGSPGSGKSVSCNILADISSNNIEIIQKETTRPKRNSDGPEIIHVKKISKACDFRYNQYDFEYGFSSDHIWAHLKKNRAVVVIVNDIRTIKLLNRKFGNLTHTIYLHSNIDRTQIEKISKERYPKADELFLLRDTEKRIEKIKTIHRKYIENTYLFNTAIINIVNEKVGLSELYEQFKQVYRRETNNKNILGSSCQIIIIAGGSFAGKDNLVKAMINIEPNKVIDYKKGTTRPAKSSDNNELIHLKTLSKKYDIVYEKNGYKYGVSTNEVWDVLSKEKIVLIVLSDLEAITKLKAKFGNICSTVYLHANIDEEELEKAKKDLTEIELNKRENSISELHNIYVTNINMFDHVLLNTSESEDLYEQAFNILDFYLEGRK